MGTPRWVRFSAVGHAIELIVTNDLTNVFADHDVRLRSFNELIWNEDKGSMDDRWDREWQDSSDLAEALKASRGWKGVVLLFDVKETFQSFQLYLWPGEHHTNVCMMPSEQMVNYESDEHEPRQWMTQFLLGLAAAMKADCCGFGPDDDYYFVFQPLDPARVLSRLRDGSLLKIFPPVVHVISTKLISGKEIEALMKEHDAPDDLQYQESTAGYHLLWA